MPPICLDTTHIFGCHPLCLDAPICLDTPICLDAPYVWKNTLYVWMFPICLDTPLYVWATLYFDALVCLDTPICLDALHIFGCPCVCLEDV